MTIDPTEYGKPIYTNNITVILPNQPNQRGPSDVARDRFAFAVTRGIEGVNVIMSCFKGRDGINVVNCELADDFDEEAWGPGHQFWSGTAGEWERAIMYQLTHYEFSVGP